MAAGCGREGAERVERVGRGIRVAVAAGAAGAALALAGCDAGINVDASTTHDARSFGYHRASLTIAADNDVSVVPGRGGAVRAERWLTGAAGEAGRHRWALSGGTLTLTATCSGVHLDCGSRYRVAVPKGVALRIATRYGDVEVRDVGGGLDVDATYGDTTLTRVTGAVRVASRYGEVNGTGLRSSDLRARSDNGDLRLAFTAVPDRVTVLSTYGEIDVRVPRGTYHTVTRSRYGDIRNGLTNDPASDRVVTAETDNGDVRLSATG